MQIVNHQINNIFKNNKNNKNNKNKKNFKTYILSNFDSI